MSPLAILLFIQETLPPPPAPTSSPDINTAQVIGVVIISLGLIMMGALALRPIVARKLKPVPAVDTPAEATSSPEAPAMVNHDSGSRSIIQFPKSAQTALPVAQIEQSWVWPEGDVGIEDRFRRVISDSGRRRKLGDRQPNMAEIVPPTRLRTVPADPALTTSSRTASATISPIVPMRDRRLGSTAVIDHEPALIVEPEFWPAIARTSEETEKFEVRAPLPQPGALPEVKSIDQPEPQNAEASVAGIVVSEVVAPARIEPATVNPVVVEQDWEIIVNELSTTGGQSGSTEPAGNVSLHDDLSDVESGGNAPIEAEVELVALGADEQASSDESSLPQPVSETLHPKTMAGIAQTVRDLIYCANAGKLINGFALYSDPYLFRFMDSTGLDEAAFRERFASIQPRPASEWERLDQISDIVILPDHRIEATVSYVDNDGRPTNGEERFRFDYSVEHGFWMIDDIQTL